jgi:hypothetical protein
MIYLFPEPARTECLFSVLPGCSWYMSLVPAFRFSRFPFPVPVPSSRTRDWRSCRRQICLPSGNDIFSSVVIADYLMIGRKGLLLSNVWFEASLMSLPSRSVLIINSRPVGIPVWRELPVPWYSAFPVPVREPESSSGNLHIPCPAKVVLTAYKRYGIPVQRESTIPSPREVHLHRLHVYNGMESQFQRASSSGIRYPDDEVRFSQVPPVRRNSLKSFYPPCAITVLAGIPPAEICRMVHSSMGVPLK